MSNASLPVYQQDSKPESQFQFPCSRCGACCRRAGKSGFMPDRGDGACVHLTQDNLCSIYETRPELCNMERMWEKRNRELDLEARGITKLGYFKVNSEVCNSMIKEDQMDEKYMIDLSKYPEMGEKISQNEENQLENGKEDQKIAKNEANCFHCGMRLIVHSIISLNNQVNVGCENPDCGSVGFIHKGKIYLSDPKNELAEK